MDELDRGTWSTPTADTSWDGEDQDDSVEVFVFGADDEPEEQVAPEPRPGDDTGGLAPTLTSEDVAGDDWNDDTWLETLDSFDHVGEEFHDDQETGAAPPRREFAPATSAPAPAGTDAAVPAASAFVAPPPRTVPDDRLDEALESIDRSGARAQTDDDADVASLLRELSMLNSGD